MPVAQWMRGPLKPLLMEMLGADRLRRQGVFEPEPIARMCREHLAGKADHRKLLWTLLALLHAGAFFLAAWGYGRLLLRTTAYTATDRPLLEIGLGSGLLGYLGFALGLTGLLTVPVLPILAVVVVASLRGLAALFRDARWPAARRLAIAVAIPMCATVIYRRWVFAEVGGFDAKLRSCADYELYLRIARRFSMGHHEHLSAEYRWHGANMSGNAARMLKASLASLRDQRGYVIADPNLRQARRAGVRLYREYYGNQVVGELRRHERSGA